MEGISSRQVLGEGTCVTTLSLSGASGETVTMYVLTLRLPMPIPSKYPTPGGFPMGVSLKQEKPPVGEGFSRVFYELVSTLLSPKSHRSDDV